MPKKTKPVAEPFVIKELPKLTKKEYTEAMIQIKDWIYGKNTMKARAYIKLLDQVEAYELATFGKVKKK
jgi:hypothetical protein